ncbi:MAG: LamG domain-containing protein, partial [Nanoarchaeota archaeon]|nr:LamG domain-containing protein [Nanoarchaeota archaeon]
VAGKLDTALSFDGVNDYVDLGNDASLNPQSITFLAWIKINGWRSSIPYHEPIVKHSNSCNSNGFGLAVNHRGSLNKGLYLISFSNGVNPGDFATGEILEAGIWGQVGFIWESLNPTTSRQKLISNGDVIQTRDINIPVPSNIDTNFLIGQGIDCWEMINFNGSIDEVAIYNRALSADEILSHYNAQKDNYPSSGDYESKVLDAGSTVAWDTISWAEDVPYGEELPDNGVVETVSGGANMTGNVLLMHMDEASGTIVDSSGNGNDGTAYGGVNYGAAGKIDKALSFDGVDDYIGIPHSTSLTFGASTDFSFEAWFKTSGSAYTQTIIDTRDSSSGWQGFGVIVGAANVGLFIQDYQTDYINVGADSNYNDGLWHYVAIVADRDGTAKIYLDGTFKDETSMSTIGTINNGQNDIIGDAVSETSSWEEFNGAIDEVAIYNRVLSEEEILDNYKRGALRLNISARSCDDAACDGETTWDKICTSSPCDITALT